MAINPDTTILPDFPPLDAQQYAQMQSQAQRDPAAFWAAMAAHFNWMRPWHTVKDTSFTGDVHIRWFEGAQLNITVNCLDRFAAAQPEKTALLWEGDAPGETRKLSYRELLGEVCRLSHALISLGVRKGDRVTLYMPMLPEAAVAMLACARIGAVHSVVFAGFSADSLRSRIVDCRSDFVITATCGRRGGKILPLKETVDAAIAGLHVRHVLVLETGYADNPPKAWSSPRDVWWHERVTPQPTEFPPAAMDAEDPLFILYTSGSTGSPKGVVHTTAGYMVYSAVTTRYSFDLRPHDIYWCTADIGWITGHSYLIYGPLLNGATSLMFEGVPTYPDPARWWQVVDAHAVTILYTAPTAIRSLMAQGDRWVTSCSRASLRLLGSVGEPINPEAWRWYHEVVGERRCPIADTWWQTETGGHLMTPLPGIHTPKPGACMQPFFGIRPELFDSSGRKLEGEAEGMLVIADSWPGQARTLWGDHDRFRQTYFSTVPGYYFTSDGARRDADGDYWITGRVDDVINVSGHRLGTAEIESCLVAHPQVAEAAVVGYPHAIKGQGIYAFVTLNADASMADSALAQALISHVRRHIGALASPDFVHLTPGLPKTRSGKIMRRILRKIAENELDSLGDTSTLLDPAIVAQLIDTRLNR